MNAPRRKRINEIVSKINDLISQLEAIDIEAIADEEQEYFDNMPEGLQQSDRGQVADVVVVVLNDAVGDVSNAIDSLNDAVSNLESAVER